MVTPGEIVRLLFRGRCWWNSVLPLQEGLSILLDRETVGIFRHLTPASKIESDGLKIYNGLGQPGYQHDNH